MTPTQLAIVQAAREAGEDPAYALAVAERESDFDPHAHSSKTIYGLYQMRGDLRRQFGLGNTDDPLEQARGFFRYLPDVRARMARVLGRTPTDAEAYLGHHFGPERAARTLSMDPSIPTNDIFTPYEMSINPHFGRAGTIGRLNGSVLGDIGRRMTRFGGSAGAVPMEPADFSQYGEPIEEAGEVTPEAQNYARNSKWAKPGPYRTDLGDQEGAFRQWVKDNKVPFDPTEQGPTDYDMRGFWKAAQQGDPRAQTAPNPNDGKIHYDDYWKTPYHQSFSNDSQWAQPNAPHWNDKDQLINSEDNSVVFDERAPKTPQIQSPPIQPAIPGGQSNQSNPQSNQPTIPGGQSGGSDFSQYGEPVE